MPLANVNAPRGFTLARQGGKREVKRVARPVAASRSKDLMIGDAYVVGVDGNVVRSTASTDLINGIVEAIQLNPIVSGSQGPVSQDYVPAADAGGIIGIEDPDAQFEVQIATIALATDSISTAAIVDADGNQPLRRSRQSIVLDASHKQFQILGLVDSPADNAEGAYAKVLVRLLQTL